MQMADPLTALIHAVQVMNFLKTLIVKTHRERQQLAVHSSLNTIEEELEESVDHECWCKEAAYNNLLRVEYDEKSLEIRSKSDVGDKECSRRTVGHTFEDEYEYMELEAEAEGILNRLSLRKGMQKLCRHPVFQLSKIAANKTRDGAP